MFGYNSFETRADKAVQWAFLALWWGVRFAFYGWIIYFALQG